MCTYSMVIDKFTGDFQPWIIPQVPIENPLGLQDLINRFKIAQEAAKVVDNALGSPDCEDPEKVKLVERVAELEQALKKALGTYVLKDGDWYLGPSGAYCNRRLGARRFQGKAEAEAFAADMIPKPRAVKVVHK